MELFKLFNQTPLIYAAAKGNASIVRLLLLKEGLQINAQDI